MEAVTKTQTVKNGGSLPGSLSPDWTKVEPPLPASLWPLSLTHFLFFSSFKTANSLLLLSVINLTFHSSTGHVKNGPGPVTVSTRSKWLCRERERERERENFYPPSHKTFLPALVSLGEESFLVCSSVSQSMSVCVWVSLCVLSHIVV